MKVALAVTHHYYNCDKAKRLLRYKPLVSMREGIALALRDFTQTAGAGRAGSA